MLARPSVAPSPESTHPAVEPPTPEVQQASTRNLVVVHNPMSTNAEAIRPRLDALYTVQNRWATTTPIIETTADDAFLTDLDNSLTENSDVVISGGDGAVKRVLEHLHKKELTGIRVILVGAGNKNDMASMVNGKDHVADPLHVLEHGQEVDIFPLVATFAAGTVQERIIKAFYSLGLGATAITARLVNDEGFRKRQIARDNFKIGKVPIGHILKLRRIAEYLKVGDAIMRSVPFRIVAPHEPALEPPALANRLATSETSNRLQRTIGKMALLPYKWRNFRTMKIDAVFAGGEWMAGGDIHMPTTLGNPVEIAMSITPDLPHRALGSAAILKYGLSNTVGGVYRAIVRDRVRTQADGEWLGLMPAGEMTVGRSQKAITVLALRAAEIEPPERFKSIRRIRSAILAAHEHQVAA